jgi:endonuclease/exonuclease/phosphatase family metal-dependent hydrolase
MKRLSNFEGTPDEPTLLTASGIPGRSLAWKQFDGPSNSWHANVLRGQDGPNVVHTKFTMLSYNLWFGAHRRKTRLTALLDLLKTCLADCVCLQEVTSFTIGELLRDPFIRETYCCSMLDNEFQLLCEIGYDVVMLVRPWLATGEIARYELTSRFGRNFLLSTVRINNVNVGLGCVHLESTSGLAAQRARQLKEIYSILEVRAVCLIWCVFCPNVLLGFR